MDSCTNCAAALKEELHLRFESHAREHTLMSEALTIAREALNKRLYEMNELREQIYRERSEFVSQAVYDTAHRLLSQRVQNLETQVANYAGRFWMLAIVPGGLWMLMQLLLYFIKAR